MDENSRAFFLGDACNSNLHLGGGGPGSPNFTSVEKALFYLKRVQNLHPRYDRCYNGHYDFRPLGERRGEDVLPDVITACEQIVAGTAKVEIRPAALPKFPTKPVVTIGRTNVSFIADGIHESC